MTDGRPASRNSWFSLTSAVVYGTGYGLAYPSLNAFVVDQADDRLRGSALGMFATALGGGTLMGPVIGGFLVQFTGLAAMFLWLALASLAGALLFAAAFLSRKPPLPDRPTLRPPGQPGYWVRGSHHARGQGSTARPPQGAVSFGNRTG